MKDLFTITDIAAMVGCDPNRLYRRHHLGMMPPPEALGLRHPLQWSRASVIEHLRAYPLSHRNIRRDGTARGRIAPILGRSGVRLIARPASRPQRHSL